MNEKDIDQYIEHLFLIANLEMSQIIEEKLYRPVKHELAEKKVTHSLGHRKELTKAALEELLDTIKKQFKAWIESDVKVTTAAISFMDQLNTYNDFNHPEVKKRALILQEAIGNYVKITNKEPSFQEKEDNASSE